MDDEIYCCLGCVVVIFLVFAGFSLFGVVSDLTANYDEICLDSLDTGITNYSFESNNGKLHEDYTYAVFFTLTKVPSSLNDSKIFVSLYDGDHVVLSSNGEENLSLIIGHDTLFEDDIVPVGAVFNLDKYSNVTHCVITIVKGDNIVFNTTQPFDMNNYEYFEPSSNFTDSEDNSTISSTTSHITHVASVNSDKFHDPSCSQAQRIKDYNRITFSSREDAINAGYSPCGICNP